MTDGQRTRFNFITEPLFRVRQGNQEFGLSLPQVFEALGCSNNALDFVALRPHQRHAWYAFLVQLAAMALHMAGEGKLDQSAACWAELLREMTDGDDAPWCLVVEDLAKPAFMQPPVPEGKIDKKKWKCLSTPGAIDLLLTAKNHDVKAQLIDAGQADHWSYALISLQTMQGYSGPDNHGIARMNSGFGSRPCVTMATADRWDSRFQRDVPILLEQRADLIESDLPYRASGSHALLWLQAWDGRDAISLADCDPYFIEICRRLRLVAYKDVIRAYGLPTISTRTDAKELKGVTGDPWTPVDRKDAKALTVGSSGFDYKLINRLLLSGDFKHGITWRQDGERSDMFFLATALTRGQGKTEGLHQRELRIPAQATGMLTSQEGKDRLARLSIQRIERCDEVRRKVLHLALCAVTQGAPDGKLNFQDKRTNPWLTNLEHSIDAIFFDRLFTQLDLDDGAADQAWVRELIDLALIQINEALRSIPQPTLRRYRVESTARGMFFGLVHKHFPDLFERDDEGKDKPDKGEVYV